MNRLALLLCGLIGCIPRQSVEAPYEIRIESVAFIKEVELPPTRTIHWTVNRRDFFVSLTEVEPGQTKYRLDEDTLVITSLKFNIIQAECFTGITSLYRCERDGGTIRVMCHNIDVDLTCQIREGGNVIPKKEKEPEPQQEESEPDPGP